MSDSARGTSAWLRWTQLGLAACGVALVLVATSRYGIGLAPDSASYLAAARSLLASGKRPQRVAFTRKSAFFSMSSRFLRSKRKRSAEARRTMRPFPNGRRT